MTARVVPRENKERIFERGFGNNTWPLPDPRDFRHNRDNYTGDREPGEEGPGLSLTIPPGSYRFPDSGEATGWRPMSRALRTLCIAGPATGTS